ncbi:MAG: FliH/SctL family protein [Rhodospirillaceae bacterium]
MSPARSASARSKPFTFDRSFDDPSKVYLPGEKYGPAVEIKIPKKVPTKDTANNAKETEPEAPPPPPKIYTEADLEAAKEDGYVEGHTAALEEAETAREHYAADALNLISAGLGALTAHQDKANAEIGQTAMRMVYAIIEKVVPVHAQASAIESVEALVREVLPLVYEEPKLTVRTHNMIAEDVQNQLNTICEKSNFNGEISVVPDYELQPGDCRVEWHGGGADRNEDRLWKEIRTIVEENVGAVDVQAMDAAADAIPDDDISADGATEDAILSDSAEPNAADDASDEDSSTAIQDAALSEQAETVVSDQIEAQQAGLEQDGPEQNKEPESLATDETTSENDTITDNKPEPSGSN